MLTCYKNCTEQELQPLWMKIKKALTDLTSKAQVTASTLLLHLSHTCSAHITRWHAWNDPMQRAVWGDGGENLCWNLWNLLESAYHCTLKSCWGGWTFRCRALCVSPRCTISPSPHCFPRGLGGHAAASALLSINITNLCGLRNRPHLFALRGLTKTPTGMNVCLHKIPDRLFPFFLPHWWVSSTKQVGVTFQNAHAH